MGTQVNPKERTITSRCETDVVSMQHPPGELEKRKIGEAVSKLRDAFLIKRISIRNLELPYS